MGVEREDNMSFKAGRGLNFPKETPPGTSKIVLTKKVVPFLIQRLVRAQKKTFIFALRARYK